MAIISFSYVDLPDLWSHNCLLVNQWDTSWIKTTQLPLLEASHSRTKVLGKIGIVNIIVEWMPTFKIDKACLATSLNTKEFFLNSDVHGPTTFHNILQTFYIILWVPSTQDLLHLRLETILHNCHFLGIYFYSILTNNLTQAFKLLKPWEIIWSILGIVGGPIQIVGLYQYA